MIENRRGLPLLLAGLVLAITLSGCAREQDPPPATSPSATGPARPSATAEPRSSPGKTSEPRAVGLPNAGTLPEPSPPPQVYAVQPGDTLSGIARRFGCDLQTLVKANNLADPNALQVGQTLRIPTTDTATGPSLHLLPDSEFVYGPAYADFDTAAFCTTKGGYLAGYRETVDTQNLSGPEIVDLIAHRYSVGPRLLLAILELRSGWVTDPNPAGRALSLPMGYNGSGWELLSRQLAWAADELNRGYYNWRGRGVTPIAWGDGTATRYAPDLNAATAGLHYFFALDARRSEWEVLVSEGPGSFVAAYRALFGDPARYAIEPLIPADTIGPALTLPWSKEEMWYYTGGPHGGWNEGSAWTAVDFVPDEGYLGCQAATAWAVAAAEGVVTHSQNGEVLIDLDGDGHEQTGWVLFYLHVAGQGRVPAGTRVRQGDPIGHPSCEGGYSESTHLHFARKYNGEWIAADGPLPLILSGWQFSSGGTEYEGQAGRGDQERTACECRDADYNGLAAGR